MLGSSNELETWASDRMWSVEDYAEFVPNAKFKCKKVMAFWWFASGDGKRCMPGAGLSEQKEGSFLEEVRAYETSNFV